MYIASTSRKMNMNSLNKTIIRMERFHTTCASFFSCDFEYEYKLKVLLTGWKNVCRIRMLSNMVVEKSG